MSVSIVKKVLMALSGFFLLFFLLQHLAINMLSVVSPTMFNETSQFMGTNPLVQFLLQPVLMFGVLFHLGMGIYLEQQNRAARPVKYAFNNPAANSTWMSRNMIITGIMIMLFLGLHLYDFWVHEMQVKYAGGDLSGLVVPADAASGYRYYPELVAKFQSPVRVGIYVLSFVFLGLHLLHGFQSAFQSVGFRHRKYTPVIQKLGNIYAIAVPAGFVFIAVYHLING
jgi:succinate dehydrogenase / fumarate reductase cytochrome b subunit